MGFCHYMTVSPRCGERGIEIEAYGFELLFDGAELVGVAQRPASAIGGHHDD
jgi:hypothetical protein